MSAARLHVEEELRQVEEQLRLDEEKRARVIRAELATPPSAQRHRVYVRHQTRHLLVLGKDGRSVAAQFLLDWWKRRGAHGGARRRVVTTSEILRVATAMRRLE